MTTIPQDHGTSGLLRVVLLGLVLLLAGVAFADTSTWTAFGALGGSSSDTSYISKLSAGILSSGRSSSSAYQSVSGFLAGVFAAADTGGPTIADVKVEDREIKANDYVPASGTFKATITDPNGVDPATSFVAQDSTRTYFSAFSGSSSYNTTTGLMTFAYGALADGDHTLSIHAVDTGGNFSSAEVVVKIDSSDVKALNSLAYPNPFNPSAGQVRIAYMLNKDSAITIYVFNAINQPVWKYAIATGAEGGHAGYNEVLWNGIDSFGQILSNDIYFIRIVADGKKVIGKIKLAVVK